jgi:hypothetical protein
VRTVGCLLVAVLGGLAAADTATATTYVSERFGSPGPRVRPATITQGADAVYTDLSWSSWGAATARADGTFQGLATSVPVRVTVSRPRRCGRQRLYTRAVARIEGGGSHAIENVGCRIAVLQGEEGTPAPRLTALVRPQEIARPPSAPLAGLRWKRWTRPVARARGRTVESGRTVPVRIAASRAGFCPAAGALAYRRLRVVVGAGARRYAYTSSFGTRC